MYNNKREIKQYKDFSYTIIAHSTLLPEFGIFLRGKGLKEIVNLMKDDEDLQITVFSDSRATKFEIIDTHEKYKDGNKI